MIRKKLWIFLISRNLFLGKSTLGCAPLQYMIFHFRIQRVLGESGFFNNGISNSDVSIEDTERWVGGCTIQNKFHYRPQQQKFLGIYCLRTIIPRKYMPKDFHCWSLLLR